MTSGYSPHTCEERLKKANLEPICLRTHCEELQLTRIYHEWCSQLPIYSPIQSLGCYNSRTGEWRFDRQSRLAHTCEELKMEDPDWEITECYCCCFLTDTAIDDPLSAEQARERFAEILGLDGPVSEPVLAAALEHNTYARNLLATRGVPEMMAPLLANPPTVAEEPSTAVLAGRAAKALAVWARTGFTVVDEATYQRRMSACASCPHELEATRHPKLHRWIADGERPKVCGLCGCAVAKKARLSSEQCPAEDVERPGFTRWGEPRR